MKRLTFRHSGHLLWFFGLAVVVLGFSACRKSTPVDEVSISDSGVALQIRETPEVDLAWPQWRGPSMDGRAGDATPPTTWDDSTNIVWQADIPGRGHSSPIVIGDQVVLGTADDSKQQQMLVSYDLGSGVEKWRRVIHEGNFPSAREVHNKATNANGTPASDGELIVNAFLNQERIFVTAVDLNGEVVWQSDVGAFASKFGYAPSPVLYQSFVILAADNFGGG
ncbi:MAG: PQQ-binding-like beta-propeller repeat protein, partial [Rhodopirellula sp. JB055]|uniref:outer membrane protein assembly factor BamB family protein n=1 Tax=Rhodopirellula sp. JB055 TaxID=3342846 RepID=UPI00370AE38A